jgi:hypothetical protein
MIEILRNCAGWLLKIRKRNYGLRIREWENISEDVVLYLPNNTTSDCHCFGVFLKYKHFKKLLAAGHSHYFKRCISSKQQKEITPSYFQLEQYFQKYIILEQQ